MNLYHLDNSLNLYSRGHPFYIRRDQSRGIDAIQNSMALPGGTYQWVSSPSHIHLCNIHSSSRRETQVTVGTCY